MKINLFKKTKENIIATYFLRIIFINMIEDLENEIFVFDNNGSVFIFEFETMIQKKMFTPSCK